MNQIKTDPEKLRTILLASATKKQATEAVPNLADTLVDNNNAIGLILSLDADAKWSKKDAQCAEKLILQSSKSPRMAEQYLRVLRKACRHWALSKRQFVTLPRIPVLPAEAKHPFRANYPKAIARYEAAKKLLRTVIVGDESAVQVRVPGIVELVVSAVLFGGLDSMDLVVALIHGIAHLSNRLICVDGKFHLELLLPWHGIPDVEFRRWQPDPLSATLLLRLGSLSVVDLLTPVDSQPCSDKEIATRIKKLFRDRALRFTSGQNRKLLTGLPAVVQAAQVVAFKSLPVVLAEYASRYFLSNSFPRSTLQRFSSAPLRSLKADALEITPLDESRRMKAAPNSLKQASENVSTSGIEKLNSAFDVKTVAEMRRKLHAVGERDNFVFRMSDFADYLLAVPTPAGKRMGAAAVRNAVELLVQRMASLTGDMDVAKLPTEIIEKTYIQMIDGTGAFTANSRKARKERVILARALRRFHEYLMVCCSHGELSDRSILFCGEFFSEIDADLITVEEFRRDLQRVDEEEWTDATRRSIRIMLILGFRCGLRRQEVLYLRIGDLKVDRYGIPAELFVRDSDYHSVKTLNAWRRIPLSFLPEDELKELAEWYARRKSEITAGHASEFLFADIGRGVDVLTQSIFRDINRILSIEGPAVHFHHARHSALTYVSNSLIVADIPLGYDLFPHISETSAWVKNGAALRRAVYNHDCPTRKHPYKLAQFAGHGSVRTTYLSYVHDFDWLLAAYMRTNAHMRPDLDLVRNASGVARSTRQGWERAGGDMAIPLNMFRQKMAPLLTVNAQSLRRETSTYANSANWSHERRYLLYCIGTWNRPVDEIVRMRFARRQAVGNVEHEITVAREELGRAEYILRLCSAPNVGRHRMQLWRMDVCDRNKITDIACPLAPVQPHDKEIVNHFAEQLTNIAYQDNQRGADNVQRALWSYVHRVWRYEDRVMFHSLSELEEAKNYVEFLRKLEINLKDIGWYSFDKSERAPACSAWRKGLHLQDYHIEIIGAPNPKAYTSEWFEIMPNFKFKTEDGTERYTSISNPGAYGFRFLMVMGFIRFGRIFPK